MSKTPFVCLALILCFFCLATHLPAAQAPQQAQEVLEYWFGPLQTADDYPEGKSKLWFGGGNAIDNDIRNCFGKLVEAAIRNELDAWKETPKGRLALLILLDQFTRNIYRGSPEAFAYDGIAQKLVLEGIAQGQDQSLLPVERVFFYLPLEHSEDMGIQKLSVEKFHSVISLVPAAQVSHFISFKDYAQRHYDIIAQFGRYPHRNAILGRKSTPEEIEFLKGPNSSF
ncbi:MAG TPA: DUF924 family protein [Parachlamydiaceae bacterium]|nr:DUF924 family protein [Parachlamydiaceae bacterium]